MGEIMLSSFRSRDSYANAIVLQLQTQQVGRERLLEQLRP